MSDKSKITQKVRQFLDIEQPSKMLSQLIDIAIFANEDGNTAFNALAIHLNSFIVGLAENDCDENLLLRTEILLSHDNAKNIIETLYKTVFYLKQAGYSLDFFEEMAEVLMHIVVEASGLDLEEVIAELDNSISHIFETDEQIILKAAAQFKSKYPASYLLTTIIYAQSSIDDFYQKNFAEFAIIAANLINDFALAKTDEQMLQAVDRFFDYSSPEDILHILIMSQSFLPLEERLRFSQLARLFTDFINKVSNQIQITF